MKLDSLNEMQKKAVVKTDGPLLVLAGAGSGKTKVLTTKIAYLIEQMHINPYNILAITFTNKAAREMKDRITNMLGMLANSIQISTFHSFGLTIVRENAEKLDLKSNFTILDSEDSLTIIKKIMKDLNINAESVKPKYVKNQISGAKNELMSPLEYERFAMTEQEKNVVEIYKVYQKRLLISNSVDFDDLLMMPIMLFRKNPDILERYQERFKYILIDEYQDTNEAQYTLVKMISSKYKNVCVVGDNDQSIYSFRGANYQNILNFEKDYKSAETIMLEENYRSTKNILKVANEVIVNNNKRKDKNLWTENEVGNKVKYYRASDEKDEAIYVTKEIQKLIDEGIPKNEIAVLYRTNAQSRAIEEALLRENIPYKVIGSFYFYNRKEIKDLICYLKLIHNSYDDNSLLRVINVPKRGIGDKTIQNITEKATEKSICLYDAIESGKELIFKNKLEYIKKEAENCSLTDLIDLILNETGMKEELVKEKTIESEIRLENLEEFKSITKNFEEKYGIISLDEFLDEISLVADVEEHKNDTDVVTLMTIHSAKGLEFDNVFIIGMEEGIFPHFNSFLDANQIEEERRLCYVAITRAKKNLWIINAKRRMIYGKDGCNPPSRFLQEIDTNDLDISEAGTSFSNKIPDSISNFDKDATYTMGEKVYQDMYGEGIIVGIDDEFISIAFEHPYGIKKFIKGHKSIRKVDKECII